MEIFQVINGIVIFFLNWRPLVKRLPTAPMYVSIARLCAASCTDGGVTSNLANYPDSSVLVMALCFDVDIKFNC